MPKLWIERDEHGNRRVPVLLHRLRVRISDSLFPTKEKKAVFRIECEYANGAARWVIYRQLSDFVKLHGRYKASNYLHRNVEGLPELPRTSACIWPVCAPVILPFYRPTFMEDNIARTRSGSCSCRFRSSSARRMGKLLGRTYSRCGKFILNSCLYVPLTFWICRCSILRLIVWPAS